MTAENPKQQLQDFKNQTTKAADTIKDSISNFTTGVEDALRAIGIRRTTEVILPLPVKRGSLSDSDNPLDYIEFQYNPTERQRSKSADYKEIQVPGLSDPIYQFVAGGSDTISFSYILDQRAAGQCLLIGDNIIESQVSWLRSKLVPERKRGVMIKAPPKLLFVLGNESAIVRLKSVQDTITSFYEDGTPRSAKVSITLVHVIDKHRQPLDLLVNF